jgi:hypothetical protein
MAVRPNQRPQRHQILSHPWRLQTVVEVKGLQGDGSTIFWRARLTLHHANFAELGKCQRLGSRLVWPMLFGRQRQTLGGFIHPLLFIHRQ